MLRDGDEGVEWGIGLGLGGMCLGGGIKLG